LNPTINKAAVMQRITRKIERGAERIGAMPAIGTQAVVRCNGIVCKDHTKYYVETGLVGIALPKFSGKHLAARLAGLWVN
jgi:hypothetical protein